MDYSHHFQHHAQSQGEDAAMDPAYTATAAPWGSTQYATDFHAFDGPVDTTLPSQLDAQASAQHGGPSPSTTHVFNSIPSHSQNPTPSAPWPRYLGRYIHGPHQSQPHPPPPQQLQQFPVAPPDPPANYGEPIVNVNFGRTQPDRQSGLILPNNMSSAMTQSATIVPANRPTSSIPWTRSRQHHQQQLQIPQSVFPQNHLHRAASYSHVPNTTNDLSPDLQASSQLLSTSLSPTYLRYSLSYGQAPFVPAPRVQSSQGLSHAQACLLTWTNDVEALEGSPRRPNQDELQALVHSTQLGPDTINALIDDRVSLPSRPRHQSSALAASGLSDRDRADIAEIEDMRRECARTSCPTPHRSNGRNFPCINPKCKAFFDDHEGWAKHLQIREPLDFYRCPDPTCNKIIRRHISEHLRNVHGYKDKNKKDMNQITSQCKIPYNPPFMRRCGFCGVLFAGLLTATWTSLHKHIFEDHLSKKESMDSWRETWPTAKFAGFFQPADDASEGEAHPSDHSHSQSHASGSRNSSIDMRNNAGPNWTSTPSGMSDV